MRSLSRMNQSLPVAALLLLIICAVPADRPVFAQQVAHALENKTSVRFTDIRKEAGITFVQDSTESDQKYYLETMGTGVGWIDYDQDGLMDLYFVESGATDAYKPAK